MKTCMVDFTIFPSNITFPLGTFATFRCQHLDAEVIITWRVNGTSLKSLGLKNITTQWSSDERFDSLIILAQPMYNSTTIECIATRINSEMATSTPPVRLIIQGKL